MLKRKIDKKIDRKKIKRNRGSMFKFKSIYYSGNYYNVALVS